MHVPATAGSALVLLSLLPGQAVQFRPSPVPGLQYPLAMDYATGDLDGDGDLDLAVVSPLGPRLLRNDGNESWTDLTPAMPALAGNQRTATFVDVDGDGAAEVLLTWTGLARLFRYMGGGGWLEISHQLPTGLPTVSRAVACDLDLDGDQDLLRAGHAIDGGECGVLWNDGFGTFTMTTPFGTSLWATVVVPLDVDGDADFDVVFSNLGVHLWRNDGGGVFTNVSAAQLPTGLAAVSHVAAGDLDLDGTTDLLASNINGLDLLLMNDGAGLFTAWSGRLPSGIGSSSSSALCDFDDDGDLDVWRGTANFGRPVLLENDGSGMFSDLVGRVPSITSWQSMTAAADFDGDGDPELLVAGLGTRPTVFWNRHRHVELGAPPTPGGLLQADVFGQPVYGSSTRIAVLAVGLRTLPQSAAIPPFGRLGIDPAGPMVWLGAALQPFGGPAPFALSVPPLPQLVGLQLAVQGLVEDAPGLAFARFTQLCTTTVQ